jgi:hypothetical protein
MDAAARLNGEERSLFQNTDRMSTDWKEEMRNYVEGAISHHLHEESPQAEQPGYIFAALRPHQLSLLAAARQLETYASLAGKTLDEPVMLTRYGVLADRVGAGKSLVALSMVRDPPVAQTAMTLRESGIARILGVREMTGVQEFAPEWRDLPNEDVCNRMFPRRDSRWYTRTAFMVVPHNVMSQWESYVRDQTQLQAVFIKKTRDCDYERGGFLRDLFTADIVIVSCTMLRKLIGAISYYGMGNLFARIVWSRFFIDEADTVTCSLRPGDIGYRFMWLITGSWLNMMFPSGLFTSAVELLPNTVRDLIGNGRIAGVQSSVNVVANAIADSRDPRFASLIVRNRDEWIDASLKRPTVVHETVMCRAPPNVDVLRGFISPAAMEALHAGDTTGAIHAMGLKTTSKDSVVEKVTGSLRSEIAQAEQLLGFKQTMTYSTPAYKEEAIAKATAKVIRLKGQLAALMERVATLETQTCPICYDVPQTAALTPCCRQSFCLACLCECVGSKPQCPMCRTAIKSTKDLIVVGEGEDTEVDVHALPTKGAALLKLLSESTEDQRYLVFSAHEASFKGLQELLSARGVRCEVLQGTSARVDRLRRQFRDGVVRVLCMNARHVGAGINLEAATHVVLYHRMNVELERQVIGRAVRFERANELRVMHLVHEHETALNGAMGSEVIVHV